MYGISWADWQRGRNIGYYLFASTYQQALSPPPVHPFIRYVPGRGRVPDYGAGAASILTGLVARRR